MEKTHKIDNLCLFIYWISPASDNLTNSFFTGWSAPSAIGIAGLGGGFEIGAEVNLLVSRFTHVPNKKMDLL